MAETIIVNQADEIVGHRPRGQVQPGEIYRIAALWIMNGHGDVLLAQRVMSKSFDPGCWGPSVSGTVEVGETYDSNIAKEANEELGLSALDMSAAAKIYVPDNGYGRGYMCQHYTATIDRLPNKFILQASEVAAVRWVPIKTLPGQVARNPEQYTIQFGEGLQVMLPYICRNR